MTETTTPDTTPETPRATAARVLRDAEAVNAGISRAWGMASALQFMSRADHERWSEVELSRFMDCLEELAGAMHDALSPAMNAGAEVLFRARAAVEAAQ